MVFFLGNGLLEVSGTREAENRPRWCCGCRSATCKPSSTAGRAWRRRRREARTEPWGLVEGWIRDPDGTRIVLVQVPADHPIRRDVRDL